MTVEELTTKLNLNSIQNRMWQIVATSGLKGTGIKESFEYLATVIEEKK